MKMKFLEALSLVIALTVAQSSFGQTIPNPAVTGPALAASVHGSYSSVSTPSSGGVVNAPVIGNGDMAVMIGGPSTSLHFVVGKSDFWGVEHGVIMPVGSLVLSALGLSGSTYSLDENVGPATVTGSFTTGSSGLSLTSWIAASQNTAFIQLTNTGSQALSFSSKLLDAYGTAGTPGTLGCSNNATWLNVSPDAVFLELGNHMNIGTSAPLNGRIADMQIFNQALSSAQLNALGTPSAMPSLLQWTATNMGAATLVGSGASLNTSDPHGGSVVLTGDSSSEVSVGVMGLPQRQFTVSAWVNLVSINSGNESCIFAGLVSHRITGYPFLRGLKLVVTSGGQLSATLNTSGSAGTSSGSLFSADAVNAYTATASGSLPLNQWVQTAVTYDGHALTIYTNGTAVATTTNFPSAALVAGYNKTAIHLGDTNTAFNGCSPQGVLMQSVVGTTVTTNGDTLNFTLPAGGQATIAVAAVTDRNTNNFFAAAQQQTQGANASSINTLSQEHNQWWSNFWGKSFVQIPDQRIQNEWYASLYLLACCSSSNCPPPGLWGNFISSPYMAWEGDYTLDYNYEATFWGALACNHSELVDNYDQTLLDQISRGEAIAQHWGYQGIYLYAHLIPFPGWSDDGFTFWSQKSDALFAAVDCAMRWRYTHDTNYADRVYPYLKGVADFWDNYLVLSNNVYVDYNDAAGESGGTSDVNPATTLAFIRLVYPSLIQISEALNVDASSRAQWSNIVAKLSPLPIVPATSISSLNALGGNYVTAGENVIRDTTSGTPWPTPEVAAYQSQLFNHGSQGLSSSPGMNCSQVIFPGWDIGLQSDPATLEAASNTVYLAAEWCDYNDCCTFYPSAAAVGYDPNEILTNLDALITYHAHPNFMFELGGGGTEDYAIVPCTLGNMFLQSYQTNLMIFPNWPANQSASFGNLNACGGFLVSSAITNGQIPYVQIASTAGQMLNLVNPWPQNAIQVASSVNPTTQFTGTNFSYQTQVGEVLTLTPGAAISAPATPNWLSATATNGHVTLTWTASTGAASYNVWRSTNDSTGFSVIAANVSTTSYTDSNLTTGPNYYYEISAVNSFGQSSTTAPVFVSLVPPVPSGLRASVSSGQIQLNWNPSAGATAYNVVRSTNGAHYVVIATNVSTTNYTDSAVVDGPLYYYEVSAVNSFGQSTYSAPGVGTLSANNFTWSAPVPITTADATLSPPPGQALVGAATFGGNPYIVTLTNGTQINFTSDGSVATATGIGTANGAFSGNTGNANFNAALNEFYFDGGPKTITLNNLTPGRSYTVQFFGLDDRSPENVRQAYVQDPSQAGDVSPTWQMGDNVYVEGTFTALSSTQTFIEQLPGNSSGGDVNSGNANDLVLWASPFVTGPPTVPTGLAAVTGSNQALLNWQRASNALTYNVKRALVSGGPYTTVATGVAGTNYTDSAVTYGKTYYYVVSAVNNLGESPDSGEASVTVMTPATHILAANDCGVSPNIQFETCSEGGQDMGFITNGCWASYCGVNFGAGTLSLEARVASAGSGGNIEVRLGATSGTLIGVIPVPVTGGWQTWTTVRTCQ